MFFFFFKQKTAYEMRISDWSSDVCSSDLCWPSPAPPERGTGSRRPRCRRPGSVRHRLRATNHLAGLMRMQRINRASVSLPLGGSVAGDRQRLVRGEERSEERRVGKGGGSKCSSRGVPYH